MFIEFGWASVLLLVSILLHVLDLFNDAFSIAEVLQRRMTGDRLVKNEYKWM
jgi:hypothetical protein